MAKDDISPLRRDDRLIIPPASYRVVGPDAETPGAQDVIERHSEIIGQFVEAQRTAVNNSSLDQHKLHLPLDEIGITYHHEFGQERITLEPRVTPPRPEPQPTFERPEPPGFDLPEFTTLSIEIEPRYLLILYKQDRWAAMEMGSIPSADKDLPDKLAFNYRGTAKDSDFGQMIPVCQFKIGKLRPIITAIDFSGKTSPLFLMLSTSETALKQIPTSTSNRYPPLLGGDADYICSSHDQYMISKGKLQLINSATQDNSPYMIYGTDYYYTPFLAAPTNVRLGSEFIVFNTKSGTFYQGDFNTTLNAELSDKFEPTKATDKVLTTMAFHEVYGDSKSGAVSVYTQKDTTFNTNYFLASFYVGLGPINNPHLLNYSVATAGMPYVRFADPVEELVPPTGGYLSDCSGDMPYLVFDVDADKDDEDPTYQTKLASVHIDAAAHGSPFNGVLNGTADMAWAYMDDNFPAIIANHQYTYSYTINGGISTYFSQGAVLGGDAVIPANLAQFIADASTPGNDFHEAMGEGELIFKTIGTISSIAMADVHNAEKPFVPQILVDPAYPTTRAYPNITTNGTADLFGVHLVSPGPLGDGQLMYWHPFPPSLPDLAQEQDDADGPGNKQFFEIVKFGDDPQIDLYTPYGKFSNIANLDSVGYGASMFVPWLHVASDKHFMQGFAVKNAQDDTNPKRRLFLDGRNIMPLLTDALDCEEEDIKAAYMDMPLYVAYGMKGVVYTRDENTS